MDYFLDKNYRLRYKDIVTPFLRFMRGRDWGKLKKDASITISPFRITDEDGYPELVGVSFRIEYLFNVEKKRLDGIVIDWTTASGIPRRQKVRILYRRSNLDKGYVGYFCCPLCGRPCRTLYTDGKVFVSRFRISNRYTYQHLSRYERLCARHHRNSEEKREAVEARRQTYAGKPTKWAIRLERMENADYATLCGAIGFWNDRKFMWRKRR